MNSIQSRVNKAKQAGYKDNAIWDGLVRLPEVQEALRRGYTPIDVKQRVGLSLSLKEQGEAKRQAKLKKLGPIFRQGESAKKALTYPFKRIPEVYRQEIQQGKESMGQAFAEPSWKSLYQAPLGFLQYSFAPLTAAARTGGEWLVEHPAKAAGAPPRVAEFLGDMAEAGLEFIAPPGGILKGIKAGSKFGIKTPSRGGIRARTAKERADIYIDSVTKSSKTKIPVAKEYAAPKSFTKEGIYQEQVAEPLVSNIAKGAKEPLRKALETGQYDKGKRLYLNIVDHLAAGKLDIDDLPEILEQYGRTLPKFASDARHTISRAGRTLNYLSQLQKQLVKKYPEFAAVLEKSDDVPQSVWEKLWRGWQGAEHKRRALLVTQMATAARNALSQGVRVNIGNFDDIMEAYLSGGSPQQAIKTGANLFSSAVARVSPHKRKRLMQIMAAHEENLDQLKMLSSPLNDAIRMGKWTKRLNFMNRAQEYYFRKLGYETKLRQLLQKDGLDIATVDPIKIPSSYISEAAEYAMKMSFASTPKSGTWRKFLKAWSDIPILTTIQPFPRFAYFNALPFVMNHSPLGLARAFGPRALKELGSGNPKLFAERAAKGMIGTFMLESAWQLRQSKYAGDRWFEFKIGEPDKKGNQRVIDVRAYAPFSTYFFIADCFIHPERMKLQDFAEAAIGLNRLAGSGLIFADLLRAKKFENVRDFLARFVGAYIGSYTVPARTVKDIIAQVDPEEAVYRERRGEGAYELYAPTIQNIPFASQLLPEASSAVTGRRIKVEAPLKRQVTGFLERVKAPMAQEIDKINFPWTSVYPKTGDKDADHYIIQYMGPIVDQTSPSILTNEFYNKSGIMGKRKILRLYFQAVRQKAKQEMMVEYPTIAKKMIVERYSDEEKGWWKEAFNFDLDKMMENLQ